MDAPRRVGSRATNEQRREFEAQVAKWIAVPGDEVADTSNAEPAPRWLVDARLVSTSPQSHTEEQPFVVVLFAGPPNRPDGLAAELQRLGARVVEVDVLIGGRLHDLTGMTPDGIGWYLLRSAAMGLVAAVHIALPCEQYSPVVADEHTVRDALHVNGLPRLPPRDANRVMLHNTLRRVSADFSNAVGSGGGEVIFENPADRADKSQPHVYWEEKAGHASLFDTDELKRFRDEHGARRITAPFCAFGADVQKYFTLLATPGAANTTKPIGYLIA